MSDLKTQDTVSYDATAALTLTASAQTALKGAADYIIDSETMYELAADDLKHVKSLQKEVEEKRKTITVPLNAAVKAVNDLFRAPGEYLAQAEATLKRAMLTYSAEQERIAAIARAKAEAKARAAREEIEAQARAAKEAAEKAQRDAQDAAAKGNQEAAQKALAEMERLQAEEQAAAIEAAVVTVMPDAAPIAKTAGISKSMTYQAHVTDILALVKAVAEGRAPIEAIESNTKFLGQQARAFKKEGALYDGVTVEAIATIAARAA